MQRLYSSTAYRRQLEARGMRQQVMLGYSDSMKDGGYLAACAALEEVQGELARQAHEGAIRLAFVHGRGGTIARRAVRDKGAKRDGTCAAIAAGETELVLGTQALCQKAVEFKDLGLAVIDEQHRFGVHQRLDLAGKGRAVDGLVTTATPIPRGK